jgi:phosphocarrier protein HPr
MELIHSNALNPLLAAEEKTMSVIEKITIFHRLGLHLRAGAELARVALRFKSDIFVTNGYRKVNAKSLLDLLTLGAIYGTVLEFSADGEDASQAIQAIRELIYTWKAKNDTSYAD